MQCSKDGIEIQERPPSPIASSQTWVAVHPCGTTITCDARWNGSVSSDRRSIMKWASMYLVGFLILIGGILAALWKLGILASIDTTWIVIGVVIAVGIGIMISVSQSGKKESIEIDPR
jgi:hypothetical protein